MLIELLWVGVCMATLSLDQHDIDNVLILINYSAGPHRILIQYAAGHHQRHVADGCSLI